MAFRGWSSWLGPAGGLFFLGLAACANTQATSPKIASNCNVTAEEYAVYSAVLHDLGKPEHPAERWDDKPQYVLSDATSTNAGNTYSDPESIPWPDHPAPANQPSKVTTKNFSYKSQRSCRLKPLIEPPSGYKLAPSEDICRLFSNPKEGWSKFYEKYPNSSGLWEISRVGFDGMKNEALVYVEHICGLTCGSNHIVLLRKSAGKWMVLNRAMTGGPVGIPSGTQSTPDHK